MGFSYRTAADIAAEPLVTIRKEDRGEHVAADFASASQAKLRMSSSIEILTKMRHDHNTWGDH